jgi:hypothetical protein
MKQIAFYPCPWREVLDGWVLECKFPGANLISKGKNLLSIFDGVQWIIFIPIPESFIGTHHGYLLPQE